MILNVRKSDGVVVDVDQKYDSRLYDNVTVPDGTVTDQRLLNKLKYDSNARSVTLIVSSRVDGRFVRLNNGQAFSPRHSHDHDQIITVLHGAVRVLENLGAVDVAEMQTHLITASVDHQIIGAANNTVFINIHL